MLKVIRNVIRLMREEAELSRAMRRIARAPIDYQMLQTIADGVANGNEIEIEVRQPDGTVLTFRRSRGQNEIEYQSFRDKFNDYRNGIVRDK